jgi:hypothetical protein
MTFFTAQVAQLADRQEHRRLYRACIALLDQMEETEAYFLAKRLTMRLTHGILDLQRNVQIGIRLSERKELIGMMRGFIRDFERIFCE